MASRAQAAWDGPGWVLDERRLADQYVDNEVEEFAFRARNEVEWLNEHMAEIFSQSQL